MKIIRNSERHAPLAGGTRRPGRPVQARLAPGRAGGWIL